MVRGVVAVDADNPQAAAIAVAVDALAAGEVVAFPTDTLYGLAVDPRRPDAVARLFTLKGRPAGAAAPLVAANADQAGLAVQAWTPVARRLAARFWPGPLSLVLDAAPALDPAALGGGATVAIRVPAHAVAQALAEAFGHPITATSANRSGARAATDAPAVVAELGGGAAVVLDGGPAVGKRPSTLVDARGGRPRLLRAGAIEWERVLESVA